MNIKTESEREREFPELGTKLQGENKKKFFFFKKIAAQQSKNKEPSNSAGHQANTTHTGYLLGQQ